MIGRRVGQYEILEFLGEGGVGQVYRARDTVLGRQVAIKTLRPGLSRDHNFVTRFRTEALRLADLSHPNITILFQLLEEGQELFMVMELVLGRELDTLLESVHRLPLRESLAVVAQTVAGLAAAHRKGVIHRDIKPSNLKVTESGLLKIMDFGIARVRGSQRMTRAGQMWGTLLYASPEQIRGGDVDERSDLYSLAVVFYEMLVGTPPFTADTEHALMTAHLETPPPPLAGRVQGVDERRIEAALMRALAKRPDERFSSVDEFGRAIGASTIRGEADEILREFIAATFERTVSPAPTRLSNTHGGRAEGASESPSDRRDEIAAPRPEPSQGRLAFPLLRRLPEPLRLPAALLGAAVAMSVIGVGYLVWPVEIPRLAQVPPAPSPQPQQPPLPKGEASSPNLPQQRPLLPVPAPPPAQPAPTPKEPLPQTPAPTPPSQTPGQPGAGLAIVNISATRNADGLIVEGDITTRLNESRTVPRLRVALRDASQHELAFKIVDPPRERLLPGETSHFVVSYLPAPDTAIGVMVTFAPTEQVASAPNTPTPDFVSSYDEGLKDRANWERWLAGLNGPFHTGAFWWSGQRSLDQPGKCNGPASLGDLEFAAGCEAAKVRLTPTDIKRTTNPDYRRGWNSYSPEVGLLPQTTEPTANCGGNADSQIIGPITLLYAAVNRKDIDLYAQQWADDAKYFNANSQLRQDKDQKIKSKRTSFAQLNNIIMQMDKNPNIIYKTSNISEVEVVYSTTYMLSGQRPLTQRGIHEKYTITCYPSGKWLISSNIDEISSAGLPYRE
jgi:serine/threonine protein kinase